MDQFQGNLLFRCNNPTNDTTLDYDKLIGFLKQRAQEENVVFPTKYKLIAISLLTNSPINVKEEQFFKDNSEIGYYVNLPLKGENRTGPLSVNVIERHYLAFTYRQWSYEQLLKVSDAIRSELTIVEDIPRVVYFHCGSGIQIVIEGFGSYMMNVHNWNMKQVLDWNKNHGLPPADPTYQNSLEWFCYFYNYYKFFDNKLEENHYKCNAAQENEAFQQLQ